MDKTKEGRIRNMKQRMSEQDKKDAIELLVAFNQLRMAMENMREKLDKIQLKL